MKRRCRLVATSAVIALLALLGYGNTPAAAVIWTGANPAPLRSPMTPMASPATDSTWYLPMVFNNYYTWDSRITVANPSTTGPVQARISIYAPGNANPVFDGEMSAYSIPLGSTYSAPMTQFGLASGFYSARIHGHAGIYDVPIVAYAENYALNGSTNTYSTQEYYGVPASATALYNGAAHVPFIYDQNGWGTGIAVQNVGSATANFTVHYYGYGCTDGPFSIPPGSAVSVYPGCVGSSGVNTSAWVTNSGNQNTAVVVSQSGPHGIARAFSVADGFRFTSSTPVPILADHWQNANTAITCVNTDSTSGTITVNYASGGSSQVTVPQGGPATILQSGTGAYPTGNPNTISSTRYVNCVVAGESFYADGQGWDGVWGYTVNNRAYDQSPASGVAASSHGGVAGVTKTKARWFLDWCRVYDQSCENYSGPMPADVEFVPLEPATTTLDVNNHTAAPSTYLLGINEPNLNGQGNMCPQDYVDVWHAIVGKYYPARKLVSPGVSAASSVVTCIDKTTKTLSGPQWLDEFTSLYRSRYGDPHISVVSFHCYPPVEEGCDANELMTRTSTYVSKAAPLGAQEVWLTEWDAGKKVSGYPDGRSVPQERQKLDFLAVQPKMTRFAYYQDFGFPTNCSPANTCSSALTDVNGNLTDYGKAYWLYR